MSLISELEHIRSTLNSCRRLIADLIKRWNNGEIDTSSDSDDAHEEQSSGRSNPLAICLDSPSGNISELDIAEDQHIPGIYKKQTFDEE